MHTPERQNQPPQDHSFTSPSSTSDPTSCTASSSAIQVLSSSPISSSAASSLPMDSNNGNGNSDSAAKPTSLMEKFSYKPGVASAGSNPAVSPPSAASSQSSGLSIKLKRDFVALKNKYPQLNYTTILKALRRTDFPSLRHVSDFLDTLPAEKQMTKPAAPAAIVPVQAQAQTEPVVKKGVALTKDSKDVNKRIQVPSSSPLKSDVQSSKVEVAKPKSSIFDKYANKQFGRLKMTPPAQSNIRPTFIKGGIRLDSLESSRPISKSSPFKASKFNDDDDDDMSDFIVGDDEEIEVTERRVKKEKRPADKKGPPAKKQKQKPKKKSALSDSEEEADFSDKDEDDEDEEDEKAMMSESAEEMDDDDVADKDVEMDDDVEEVHFDDRVLEFLNTSDKRDIADIAGVSIAIASVFVESRPYASLEVIENTLFEEPENTTPPPDGARKRRRGTRKPIGEKIIENSRRKLRGYDAADSLIRKCSEYGKVITSEIHKWGISVHGEEGELEIVEVDVEKDVEDDSNDDKKSNEESEEKEAADDDDDDDDEPIKKESSRASRRSNRIKDEEDEEDEGEDKEVEKDDEEDDDDDDDVDDDDDDYGSSGKDSRHGKLKKLVLNAHQLKNNKKVGYFHRQPSLLAEDMALKNYQQVGINWLNLLYQKKLSCILADEMGLGKTIQVIAFLAHLKETNCPGPHLIVVPSSTLENWLREFVKFAPDLVVKPYYASQEARIELRSQLEDSSQYDVLVTTYNLATGNKYDQNFLRSRNFNVVVYDEGHMLKNSNSDRYAKLMKLSAKFRLLLTGTPLQNNLRELISLLAFMLPKLFSSKKDDLQTLFDQKVTTTKDQNEDDADYNPLLSQQAITNARKMMAPFVLRRKKDQVMKYLPKKNHFIKYCDLSPEQSQIYQDQLEIAKTAKAERDRRKALSAEELRKEDNEQKENKQPPLQTTVNTIMHLRKASLHPMLFRKAFTDEIIKKMSRDILNTPEYADANQQFIFEDMQVMTDFELNALCLRFSDVLSKYILPKEVYVESGKIKVMMEIVNEIINKKEKILIFSLFTQVLDILEKVMSFYNIKFLRLDGGTSVDERQDIIDTFYEDDQIPVFLLSTKAGGFGINLICATTVIIFDQSFNPHDDKQAEDRAHRVGQTKEVNVYKLITKGTIEENIMQMAENKLQLDSSMSATSSDDQSAKLLESSLFEKK